MTDKYKTKPLAHQLDCLKHFADRPFYANTSKMGTGKTWIAINDLANLWSRHGCKAALILAPNGVQTNWLNDEIPKHMPDWVRRNVVEWTNSRSKKAGFKLDSLFDPFDGLQMLLMNHEAMQAKRGFEFALKFLKLHSHCAIVVDESHAYKNPSAKRTKNLMKLKKYSEWRRIMTGTVMTNAPFDVFSQFTFLDEHILETSSFYAFKAQHADMIGPGDPTYYAVSRRVKGGRMPQIVAKDKNGAPRYKNLEHLNRLLAQHCFFVTKEECIDLPEKVYKSVYFDLGKKQQNIYNYTRDECRLLLDSNETPINKLTAFGKLSQIVSGYYIHPEQDRPVMIGENPKLELFKDRLASIVEQGSQVIVWARFRQELVDIAFVLTQLGIDFVQYHGGIKKAEREEAIQKFQHEGCPVFIATQSAGGTGLTLTAASVVIYYSNTFSMKDRVQSEDRAHRIGQKSSVLYIDLIARNTIDEQVVDALQTKKDLLSNIEEGLKR